MGFIPRRRIKENLREVEIFLEDSDNTIFKVQDVPDTFVQGRSAFKIFGSDLLKQDVPLKIELLDKAGVPVWTQPVLYGETYPSLPYRYISVEVYPPPINIAGEAELVILGQLNEELVNVEQRFRGAYNVKYSKIVNIDTEATINEQPILFYKKPEITATEFVNAQKLTSPPGTRFISGSQLGGSVNSDIRGNTFISSSEVDVQTKVNDKSESPSGDLAAQSNLWKYKTGLYKENKVLKRRGLKQEKRSPEKPQMTIRSAEDKFITKMVGSNITIKNITLPTASAVELSGLDPNKVSVEEIYNAFTFPDFEAKVEDIKSDKELVLNKPYAVEFLDPTSTDTTPKKIFTDIGDDNNSTYVDFTASYTDWEVPATSSYRFDSFIDLTIEDMRTFSGDVYRIKVSGGSDSTQGDFPVLLDTVVDAPELLVDTTSPSGVLRSGYFIDQNHIDKYWNTFGGNNNANQLSANYTMSLADGIYLSGSYETYNQVGRVDLDSTYAFTVKKDVAYTISFTAKGKKATKTSIEGDSYQSAKIFFHLSGSNLKDFNESDIQHKASFGNTITNEFGQPVGLEIEDSDPITTFKDFGIISHTFTPNFKPDRVKNTDTTIQMRIHSGEWIISDLSLRPAASTGFSPDEFQCRVPIPPNTLRPDNFDFLVEYLDINGNTAETITFLDNVAISGSALILEGTDNLLTGSLYMGNASGSGIEAAGANSAFIRSVGYKGFLSASNATGINGGFMMFSGSVLPDSGDDYKGVGLELVANSASFFKFRSNPSILDIRADKFFIGTKETQFISGSDSNIEISSSLFHLDPKNDSLIIGADATINASLAANQIRTPAQIGGASSTNENASSSIDTQGFARFVSASIGGWVISDGEFTSGAGPNSVTMSSEIGLISMGSGSTFNKGDLQGGLRVGFDTDGTFKFAVGSADSYIHADSTGVSIKSDSFDVTASVAEIDVDVFKLSATNLFISSSGGGFISAGNPRPTAITGTNKGFYVQGDTGVFLAGNAAGGHVSFDGTNVSLSSSAFYLGNDSQFVSGALGNIEISSSNFHLTPEGNVTMSGTITADSGELGGWEIESDYISKALSGHSETATSRVYLSVANDNTQNIQQGLHLYRDDDDTTNGEVKVVRVGGLSDTTNLHATASNDFGIQVIRKNSNNNYSNIIYIGKSRQEISGFLISTDEIRDTDGAIRLKSTGQITASAIQLTGEVNITGGSAKGQLDTLGAETASIKARTASFENSVTSIGAKTSSFAGSITTLGEKTASFKGQLDKMGDATASIQAKTASLQSESDALKLKTGSLEGDITASKAEALVTSSLFNANAVESSSKLSAGAISSGSKLTEGAIASSSFIAQGSRASASLFATAVRDSGSLFAASAKASASLFAIDALTSGSQATASLQSGINTLGEKTASLQSGVNTLGAKTASLQSGVNTLGSKTASLQSGVNTLGAKTASLQTGVNLLGVKTSSLSGNITGSQLDAVASASVTASLFSVAARDSASLFSVATRDSASLFAVGARDSGSLFADSAKESASVLSVGALTSGSQATASLGFQIVGAMTSGSAKTSSFEGSITTLGQETASLKAKTASIDTSITENSASAAAANSGSKLELKASIAGVSSSVSGAFTEVSTSIATTNRQVSASSAAATSGSKLELKASIAGVSSSVSGAFTEVSTSIATTNKQVSASAAAQNSGSRLILESSIGSVSSSVSGAFTEVSTSIATTNKQVSASAAAQNSGSRLILESSIGSVSSSVSGAFTETSESIATTNTEVSTSIAARQQVDILANRAAEATFSSSFTLVGEMTASLTDATASAESSLAAIGVSTASLATTTASLQTGVNTLGEKTASFESNLTTMGERTASLGIGAARATASIGSDNKFIGTISGSATIGSTAAETVRSRSQKALQEYIIYSDSKQAGSGATDSVEVLPSYQRDTSGSGGATTRITTTKIRFIYRHATVNEKMILRAFCKQSGNTAAGQAGCRLILGRDDITSAGPTQTPSTPTSSDTYDDSDQTILSTTHGATYALVTVESDISGLTDGNMYEIAIAIRSGTDTDGTGRTITMLGPSVMVTGDDS